MKKINFFEFKKFGPVGATLISKFIFLDAMVIFKFCAFRIENYQMSPVPDTLYCVILSLFSGF